MSTCNQLDFYFISIFETKGRQANARAQDAIDHLTSFMSSREETSLLGVEPPTSSLRLGFLSTIIQQFMVVSDLIGWILESLGSSPSMPKQLPRHYYPPMENRSSRYMNTMVENK